jgi:hypothetical protein
MTEQFVPYELALKLKEKDFDKPCMYPFDKYFYMDISYVEFIDWNEKYKNIDGFCSAPLWQQVIDWFREKHSIEIWVGNWGIMIRSELSHKEYEAYVKYRDANDTLYSDFFDDYKEARQAAIEHALTLI